MKTISLTNHAIRRTSQRGISFEQIELCVSFGERLNRTGVEFYILTKKCLQRLKKVTGVYMERLQGLTVMTEMDSDGAIEVITAYKNNDSIRIIKKKRKRRSKSEKIVRQ
jgi:hypothetical protein|tara:strand:+ start:74 stop:403 length:330 start_codon:yes stop_codon:yes gene_type:complete